MPEEKKGFTQKVIIASIVLSFLITFGTLLISWSNERGKRMLLEDQVRRNTEQLEKYNLPVLSEKLDTIDENVTKMEVKLENIYQLILAL